MNKYEEALNYRRNNAIQLKQEKYRNLNKDFLEKMKASINKDFDVLQELVSAFSQAVDGDRSPLNMLINKAKEEKYESN